MRYCWAFVGDFARNPKITCQVKSKPKSSVCWPCVIESPKKRTLLNVGEVVGGMGPPMVNIARAARIASTTLCSMCESKSPSHSQYGGGYSSVSRAFAWYRTILRQTGSGGCALIARCPSRCPRIWHDLGAEQEHRP